MQGELLENMYRNNELDDLLKESDWKFSVHCSKTTPSLPTPILWKSLHKVRLWWPRTSTSSKRRAYIRSQPPPALPGEVFYRLPRFEPFPMALSGRSLRALPFKR